MSKLWFWFAFNAFLAITTGSAKRLQPQLVTQLEGNPVEEQADVEPNIVMVFRVPVVWDDDALKAPFEKYGTVLEAHVVPKRGFGEVQFQQASSVAKLLAESTQYVDEKTGNLGHHMKVGSKTLSVVRKKNSEAPDEKPASAKKNNETNKNNAEKLASAKKIKGDKTNEAPAEKPASAKKTNERLKTTAEKPASAKKNKRVKTNEAPAEKPASAKKANETEKKNADKPTSAKKTKVDKTKPVEQDSNQSRRVHVWNIDWGVSWQDLKDHMRTAGEVTFADIFKESDGRSKGCGVVEYKSVEDAQNAISTLNDSTLGGRTIFVRESRKPSRTIYVGNIGWRVSWQDLKDHMRAAGEVTFVDIFKESDGRSKGCGVVEYKSVEDAQNAIQTLNDSTLGRRVIRLENYL